jgi:ribose transport system ATP-binding protein/rhamnose transport system ATP-binding protein
MFLGQAMVSKGFLRERDMRAEFIRLCGEFDLDIGPDTLARDLSVSQQQIVEILRGVQAKGRILMLDEPSAALAEHERDILYKILGRLKEKGTTIIFVSHNLDEVLGLSDAITVLRDGSIVKTAPRKDWDKHSLIESMIGRDVILQRREERNELGEVSISVRDVQANGVVQGIDLTARVGEIIGLWGLVGSGRTTFMRSIAGLEPRSKGRMSLGGVEVLWPVSARTSIRHRIALVPESRKHALLLEMDSVDNYWLGRRSKSLGWKRPLLEHAEVIPMAKYFGFNPARLMESVGRLSGGNQQKILLAKWAGRHPAILMVDEPTRGIDVGAKAEVLSSLVAVAQKGGTVIVASSELEEVLAICDRLLVFSHGRVVREIDTAHNPYSVSDIVKFGFGEVEKS